MKKSLMIKQDIKQKQLFNVFKDYSLQILSMNNIQLRSHLIEQSQNNPFISAVCDSFDIASIYIPQENFSDVIMRQLAYLKDSIDEDLCLYLISCLDGNGYFRYSLSEIEAQSLFSKEKIVSAIAQLQKLEPIGCFCFTLEESLKIQSLMSEEVASETSYILCKHLDLLAIRDFKKIASIENLSVEEVQEGFLFLKGLNPKPASSYAASSLYLQPEARVRTENGEILVELLNQDIYLNVVDIPEEVLDDELRLQRSYAKTLVSCVQRRNLTLLQILQKICSIQKDFFVEGKPLVRCTMEQVAKACDIHVSTVSRAISTKSIEFENKYIPLRHLFVRTGNSNYDASFIIEQMKIWIKNENKNYPYSDQQLQQMFFENGVNISRRVISKYRKMEKIENSTKRRIIYNKTYEV